MDDVASLGRRSGCAARECSRQAMPMPL